MASPFVPVDLDKLLDEFEENEEETKPEQLASFGTTDPNSKLTTRQRFQAPFPSIKEEALSDQGSEQCISDEKNSSTSSGDDISDIDSVSGVIEAAEAITNQGPNLNQPQTILQGVNNDSVSDKRKEKAIVWDCTSSESSDGSNASSSIQKNNSESCELDDLKFSNQYGYVQLVNEDTETASEQSDSVLHDDNYHEEGQARNSTEMSASGVLYSETGDELYQEQTSAGIADEERLSIDGNKYKTKLSIVGSIDDSSFVLSDPKSAVGEPEMSNIPLSTNVEMQFADKCNQDSDVLETIEEHASNRPVLDNQHMTHGQELQKERITENGNDYDTCRYSTELGAVGGINHNDTPSLVDSSSEPNASFVQDTVSGIPVSQGDEHTYVNGDCGPTVSVHEQPQPGQVGDPVITAVMVAIDPEVTNTPATEAQAILDDQEVASYSTVHVPGESHPASSYDENQEGNEHFAGLSEHHDHTISPDLTITVHSQDSWEAQRITSGEANLGKVPPIWVPDSVATHCMNCGLKFSVIRRRHHCRACGKALCSSCCNMKFLLPYMNNKEGRVCQVCCNALLRSQALMQVVDNQANENIRGDNDSPTDELLLDNGLEEEEEEEEEEGEGEQLPVDHLEDAVEQEITEGREPVGDVGEDTTDFAGATGQDFARERAAPVLPPLQIPITLPQDMGDTPLATPTSPALSDDSDCLFRLDVDNVRSLLPQDITALPPVLKVINGEISIQERPDPAEVMYQIKGLHETVAFLLNRNLVVKVSIVKLSCCVKHKCWCFVTDGMGAANQEEMVVLLECLRKETMLPKDVLSHFNTAFAYAKQGHTVSELGYTIFGQPFLGSSDNAGFLYVKPTYQCLKKLPLPSTPYVVGILIKRQETPWAQLFPLRLQLRLGAEYRYYPCPLFSSRTRPSVYGEVGHTIMNLLADFKNFQYTLARVTGLVIHMEEKRTLVRLPQDRYDEVVKILNASDEHVMALGANFSLQADSHLVCIQSEQGYKTQAINIQNQPRKVTGASFIVFSGAVKSSSPFMARVNIVEDGIMVQMMPEAITKLRSSLKEMKDYTITTGIPGGGGEEQVIVEWVSRKDTPRQSSLCSPVDGLQLDGFPSVKVHSGYDFTRKNAFRIQWTEMYFLGDGRQSASRDLNKLTAEVAKAFGRTLMSHLPKLSSDNCTFLGLRVSLDRENVGYLTGSNQQSLPASILSDLDNVLVPVLHAAASHHRGSAINVELLFKILRLL